MTSNGLVKKLINGGVKMRIYRYMNQKELDLFLLGGEVTPLKKQRQENTSGSGVFFLPKFQTIDAWNDIEEEDYSFPLYGFEGLKILDGIVSDNSILVEFEVKSFKKLKVSEGKYANPYSNDWHDFISVKEICMESYNLEDLTPVTWSFAGEKIKYGFDNYTF